MLKQQATFLNRLIQVIDVLVITAAFFAAYLLRVSQQPLLDPPQDYLWFLLVVLPVWHVLMHKYFLYGSIRTLSVPRIIFSLVKVHVIGGVVAAAAIYLIHAQDFRRGLFSFFLLLSFLFLTTGKLTLKALLSYFRRKGYNTRNILIIGSNKRTEHFVQLVKEHVNWGLSIAGVYCYVSSADNNPDDNSKKHCISGVEDLVALCKQQPIDEVVFCLYRNEIKNLDEYVFELDQLGITVRMVLDIYEVHRARREVSMFHGELPILTLHSMVFDPWQLFMKRCLDIAGAIVGLGITALLFPFIALAIKRDSAGPLLFGQKRVGDHGRLFRCWKFRSMYIDAEERKKELMAHNEMNGAMFKMKQDPRITRVGHFIRKTSLDELPQFWNVLKGEMSLVGTRPPTPDEVATYQNWHRRRISIKPGITGLWQVSGRNQIQEFDEVVRLDLQYIDQWSIGLDIRILLRTIKVVFMREGSC